MEFDYAKITELLQGLLMAVLPVLAYMATAYVKTAVEKLKVNLGAEKQFAFEQIVKIAVYAAEQLYVSGEGEAKKAYAIEVVQKWMDSTGIKIDIAVVEAAIENAVLENFPSFPEFDEE